MNTYYPTRPNKIVMNKIFNLVMIIMYFSVTTQNPKSNRPKSVFPNFSPKMSIFPNTNFTKSVFPNFFPEYLCCSQIPILRKWFSQNQIFRVPFSQNQYPERPKTRKLIFFSKSNPKKSKNGKNYLKLLENLQS